MTAVASALRELWGLFVEDPSFTLGIIVCLASARFLLPALQVPLAWRGIVLFAMLAVTLVENVLRSSRSAS